MQRKAHSRNKSNNEYMKVNSRMINMCGIFGLIVIFDLMVWPYYLKIRPSVFFIQPSGFCLKALPGHCLSGVSCSTTWKNLK